jgi:DNA recombination protein Rad52
MGFSDVRTRDWQGKTLSYIEGWHAISEANRIFGFDGWSRETVDLRCLNETQANPSADCAYLARVRISVRAGEDTIVREGTGAGYTKASSLAEAHALAAKEAETDATKRALSTFGNPFGLALYDREQRGVRKPGTRKPKQFLFAIHDPNGAVVARFSDPHACAHTLREKIDTASTLDELATLWRANKNLVDELEQYQSQSNGAPTNGAGAGDLDLTKPYQNRHARLWAKQTLNPRDREVAATDGQDTIDKSRLALPAPKRIRAPEHLKRVASLGCAVCQRIPADAHHLKRVQPNALAKKPGDQWVVPLCRLHHRALHDAGDETQWWQARKIDPVALAEELWARSRRINQHSSRSAPVEDDNDLIP